jgi:thiamine-phosphate pyrophosphorylase
MKEEFCGHQVAFRLGLMLLYYITDRRQFPGTDAEKKQALLRKIAECGQAGIDYIQLREKDLGTRELEELARRAVELLPKEGRTRLLINSRIDIALACGAHGVHLRANDLPASEARAIFSAAGIADAVIGVSTHTVEGVVYAEAHGADFAVFSPIFEKNGETFTDGLRRLQAACQRPRVGTPMPLLALGGVTLENAQACIEAGAAGIAGIRLFREGNVEEIVGRFKSRTK